MIKGWEERAVVEKLDSTQTAFEKMYARIDGFDKTSQEIHEKITERLDKMVSLTESIQDKLDAVIQRVEFIEDDVYKYEK